MIVIKTAKTDKDINIQSFQLFQSIREVVLSQNWFLDFYIIIFKRLGHRKIIYNFYNPYE